MKKILFLHEGKSSLPEIDAYKKFFLNQEGYYATDLILADKSNKNLLKNIDYFDVVWKFMGMDRSLQIAPNQVLVHEYASLSTKPLPNLKNLLKVKLNQKPDLRVFLNGSVKNDLKFNDSVPYCYRDMGISKDFYPRDIKKSYDFVYLGDVSKGRKVDRLLAYFSKKEYLTLLLIGPYSDELFLKYNSYSNIFFKGKVPHYEVPSLCCQARFAINFIPNCYPFNIQTSTKLLEYLALGLKVVTTHGKWVELFEKNNSCKFYYIDEDHIEIPDNIDSLDLVSEIDINDFNWDSIISGSNLKSQINVLLENKRR